MLKEFRDFIMRGNVLDLAVAVIIGAAFGGVVTSLVNDVLMPPIGLLAGAVDFSNLFVDLSGQGFTSLAAAEEAGAAVLRYGVFLNTIINFVIVAFAVFMIVKLANSLQKKKAEAPAPPPAPTAQEVLLTEIRDLLKTQAK
ncbi:MAG: large conductance mechanosensitive channel protein MscL [Caldilineaceae bacterium]